VRVVLDLTALLPEPTGVDTYLRRLPVELGKLDRASRYTIFVNAEDRDVLAGALPTNFTVRAASLRPRPARLFFQQLALPVAARALAADVVHSPSFILPLLDRRPRHVLNVHDMTSFSLPETHIPLRRSSAYRRAVVASIRRASRVLVPSRAVADELRRFVPGLPPALVEVIPHGIGPEYTPEAAAQAPALRRRLRLPERYVLFVGTIEPRKGLDVLLDAYGEVAAADPTVDLVLGGRLGWDYDGLVARIRAWTPPGRVRLLGYVDGVELPALYAGARVVAYPSREEGFGFPPLEAMACGVPVVATDTSALRENLRGAAELVPPGDARALANALRRLLSDEPLSADRRRAGLERAACFRWEATAAATLSCYREVAGGRAA
jgi:glycosyltransferase involved in cell wall biosynthesis